MLDLVKRSLTKWISAAIVLVVGIVCIVAGANQDGSSFETIALILGITLIVLGALGLCLAILAAIFLKKSILAVGLSSGLVLAFGLFFVVNKSIAGTVIGYIVLLIPYLLLVLGAVLLLNVIFIVLENIKEIKSALPTIIVSGLIGVAAIVLGALSVGNDPVISYSAQLIIFGIMVILVAILMVLATFIKVPNVVVVNVNNDKE